MPESPDRSRVANYLLAVLSPLVFLFVTEGAIRVLGIDTDLARNEDAQIAVPVWLLADETWVADRQAKWRRGGQEPIAAEEISWLYHFEEARWIGYRMKPAVDVDAVNPFNRIELRRGTTFRIQSNDDGFRERPFPEREPRTIRIVTLGDSSTFGWGVDAAETYQRLLEERLNEGSERRYEVLNLGIPGHNSRHGLGMLRHYALQLDPDVLIVGYGANDPREVPVSTDDELAADDTLLGAARYTMLELDTYKLLRRFVLGAMNPLRATPDTPPALDNAVPLARYRENLRTLHEEAAEHSARTIFMSVCTGEWEYAEATRDVANDLDAEFLHVGNLFENNIEALESGDLYPDRVDRYRRLYQGIWHERRAYAVTSDGCHPHWVGHSLIADALEPMVQRTLGIPVISR